MPIPVWIFDQKASEFTCVGLSGFDICCPCVRHEKRGQQTLQSFKERGIHKYVRCHRILDLTIQKIIHNIPRFPESEFPHGIAIMMDTSFANKKKEIQV